MKSQADVDAALPDKVEGEHRWAALLQVAIDDKQMKTIAKNGAIRFSWSKVIATSGGCVDCGGAAGEVWGEPCTAGPVEVTADPSAIHEMKAAILAMGGDSIKTEKMDNRWLAQCGYQGKGISALGATEFATVQKLAEKVRAALSERSAVGVPVDGMSPENGPPPGPGLRRIK